MIQKNMPTKLRSRDQLFLYVKKISKKYLRTWVKFSHTSLNDLFIQFHQKFSPNLSIKFIFLTNFGHFIGIASFSINKLTLH